MNLSLADKGRAEQARYAAQLARLEREVLDVEPARNGHGPSDVILDAERLRGIPAVGGRGSLGGAVRGSVPGGNLR